jgi:hypothetical protein
MILGPPGAGKTYYAQELVRGLREAGRRVSVCAKCHVAVQNFGMDADTLDHFYHKYLKRGACGADAVFAEEQSQINAYLWNELAKLKLKRIAFVLLGDWAQLDAVMDTWAGWAVKEGALERSHLVYELSEGYRLTLTQNRRSDPTLFDFYCGLGTGTEQARDVNSALEEARRRFPVKPGLADYYLTMSHRTRTAINRKLNEQLRPPEAVFYEYEGEDAAQQSFWVWGGMQLIGAGGKCKKGVFYTVAAVEPTGLVLESVRKGSDGEELTEETRISQTAAAKCLRPAWAVNYAGCQGLTLRGRVRLMETEHRHFVLKHLYVGSSRATAASLLEVA